MGYELWVSPITGYRRRGTRLADLQDLLGARITAGSVCEPLQCCPAGADAREMHRLLALKDFDVAGVRAVEDGPVIGVVRREDLIDGIVRDHTSVLASQSVISEALQLPDLMGHLTDGSFVLVCGGESIVGIITRTDLNKPAVRVYLFGLVSLLEMHLTYWLKVGYPEDSWKGVLDAKRLKKARKMQLIRTREGDVPLLADCLQFCDKREIVLASDMLTELHGFMPVEETRSRLERIEVLRNNLAHSQYNIAHGSNWVDLIALVEWMSAFVHSSDRNVEARAVAQSAMESGTLW